MPIPQPDDLVSEWATDRIQKSRAVAIGDRLSPILAGVWNLSFGAELQSVAMRKDGISIRLEDERFVLHDQSGDEAKNFEVDYDKRSDDQIITKIREVLTKLNKSLLK